jgi:hypothetical protein
MIKVSPYQAIPDISACGEEIGPLMGSTWIGDSPGGVEVIPGTGDVETTGDISGDESTSRACVGSESCGVRWVSFGSLTDDLEFRVKQALNDKGMITNHNT